MKTEQEMREGLAQLEKIMAQDPEPLHLDLKLQTRVNFEDQPNNCLKLGGELKLDVLSMAKDLERIIRATEICTLKWALGKGGGLNTKEWEFKQ